MKRRKKRPNDFLVLALALLVVYEKHLSMVSWSQQAANNEGLTKRESSIY